MVYLLSTHSPDSVLCSYTVSNFTFIYQWNTGREVVPGVELRADVGVADWGSVGVDDWGA